MNPSIYPNTATDALTMVGVATDGSPVLVIKTPIDMPRDLLDLAAKLLASRRGVSVRITDEPALGLSTLCLRLARVRMFVLDRAVESPICDCECTLPTPGLLAWIRCAMGAGRIEVMYAFNTGAIVFHVDLKASAIVGDPVVTDKCEFDIPNPRDAESN